MQDVLANLDMSVVKSRQVVEWRGAEVTFCDWNHPLVHQQSVSELIDRYSQMYHWDKLIRPGSLCVDVGAHCGDTTIPMGVFSYDHAAARPGKVLAVEPNRDVFPVLEINTALNRHWADFHLSRNAITKIDGEIVELLDHGNQNCNGGLVDANFSEALRAQMTDLARVKTPVEGARLDTLLAKSFAEADLDTLSFVKTDCEGYDKEILRSAKDFLGVYKPYLFVEWFDLFPAMEDHHDFFAAIDEIGYVSLNPQTLAPLEADVKLSDLLLVHRSRLHTISDL